MKAFNGIIQNHTSNILCQLNIIQVCRQLYRKLKRQYFHFNPLTVERYYTNILYSYMRKQKYNRINVPVIRLYYVSF